MSCCTSAPMIYVSGEAPFRNAQSLIKAAPIAGTACADRTGSFGLPPWVDLHGEINQCSNPRRWQLAGQFHWARMFASLMTCPHFSISEPSNAASSSGVEPMTTTPPCSSFSLTADSASAATASV